MSKNSLLFITGTNAARSDLFRSLKDKHLCVELSVAKLLQGPVFSVDGVIVDVDLANAHSVKRVRQGLGRIDRGEAFVVFIVDPYRQGDLVEAMKFKPDRIISRLAISSIGDPASPHFKSVADVVIADFIYNATKIIDWLMKLKRTQPLTLKSAVSAGEAALDKVFEAGRSGGAPRAEVLQEHTAEIINSLKENGLDMWIKMVRSHHDATYRHCLIVTGIATAFGQSLGFSTTDIEKISISGMLHDIGKATVPVEILEKRGPLTEAEQAIIRQHPMEGRRLVGMESGFGTSILDVISNHHEYLDGSGYPSGLIGEQISDLTRMITIADKFAGLIGHEGAGQNMTGLQAFGVLASMTEELDVPMVKAFKKVAISVGQEP